MCFVFANKQWRIILELILFLTKSVLHKKSVFQVLLIEIRNLIEHYLVNIDFMYCNKQWLANKTKW